MLELVVIVLVLLLGWLWIKYLGRDVSLQQARTKGLELVKGHLDNPVLLEDYARSKGISKEEVYILVHQGKLPSYKWHQHIFVEDDPDSLVQN